MPVTNRTSIVSFALKTLTSAVAGAVLLSAAANAAGLGKLTVLSSLGQPLRAEIELTAVGADEASGLVAQLASADAYRNANIEFNPALMSLRFEVEQRNGRQVIRVNSSQPVNEPFVDMLLELKWNGGRMVREYTFLLDPPDMRSAQSPQVAAPVDLGRQVAGSAATAPSAPVAAPAGSAPSAGNAPAPSAGSASATARPQPSAKSAERYTVKKGDNLSRIATQVKPVDVSLDMMLVALYRANPEAFSGNNMNRLKSGQILKVPESDAVRSSAPEGEARGVVIAHAVDFNAYRAKLAGQVANSTPAKEAETTQNVKGKITAKVEEKPNAVNEAKDKLTLSKSTASAPVEGKTGMAAEESIAKQKQVDEAAARVKELEKNVNDLEKLMAVKGKPVADKPAAATVVDVTPVVTAPVAAPAPVAEQATPPKPKRSLVVPPKKPVEPSLYEKMMDNLQAIGIALVVLLALAYAIIVGRRRKKFVVPRGEIVLPPDPTTPIQPFISEGGPNVDNGNSVFNSNFAPSASQLDTNEVDPVAEADVYIAYGRDAQAEEILKEALRTHPERHAVRLKLLDIYATRKDARAFESQASELYSLTRGQGDEWAQAAAVGHTIDPTNPLYLAANGNGGGSAFAAAPLAAGVVGAAAAASAYSAADFGNDFDKDSTKDSSSDFVKDFDKDANNDFGSDFGQTAGSDFGAGRAASAPDASATDFDTDFDADVAAAPATGRGAGNGLDYGDMDTALPQAADASVSPASVAAQPDNLMDFDMGDLSFEPVASSKAPIEMPAPVDEPADDPFDLAFDAPATPAGAGTATAAADDPSMDFSLDLPADPADRAPAAVSDPLDLDIMGFDIPEVPAFTEPPKAEPEAIDFDEPLPSLELPVESAETASGKAAPAPEFDLSGIDFDLDQDVAADRAPSAADAASSSATAEAEAAASKADTAAASKADTAASSADTAAASNAASAEAATVAASKADSAAASTPAASTPAASTPADYTRDDTMSAHHMEMDTKLDLAIAYQEIGDKEGARELLDEVLRGGSDDQIAKANDMKAQLS
jgi:pilus assembly protein FimV